MSFVQNATERKCVAPATLGNHQSLYSYHYYYVIIITIISIISTLITVIITVIIIISLSYNNGRIQARREGNEENNTDDIMPTQ